MKKGLMTVFAVAVALLTMTSSAIAQVPPDQGTAAQGTSMVQVSATDPSTASQGIWVSRFVNGLESRVAQEFGWRPSRPTTVMLFPSGTELTNALAGMMGRQLTESERNVALMFPAFLAPSAAMSDGNPVIMVNLDRQYATTLSRQLAAAGGAPVFGIGDAALTRETTDGQDPMQFQGEGDLGFGDPIQREIQAFIAHEYASLMAVEVGGGMVPDWFRHGLAETVAFRYVRGTNLEVQEMAVLTQARDTDTLPSVEEVASRWDELFGAGGRTMLLAHGVVYQAVKTLVNENQGAMMTAEFLGQLRGGANFETTFQSGWDRSLEDLNSQYQTNIARR